MPWTMSKIGCRISPRWRHMAPKPRPWTRAAWGRDGVRGYPPQSPSGGFPMQRFNLSGKVALVTGGNGGIGAGIARGLLECGAAVVIGGRNVDKSEAMVAELRTLGPVSAIAMDVTDEQQCHEAVRETVRRHGRLDILVNNAGIGSGKLPQDLTVAGWH